MKRTSVMILLVLVCALMLAVAAPAQTVNCSGVAAWSGNSVSYAVGALVTENGNEYKCLQAHTSQAGWDPANVPALWSLQGTCGTTGTPTPTATAKPTATATATAKPTATATATAKPTATATATAKPTATATATAKPTATATATATPSGPACWPAWVSSTAYTGGSQVSDKGENYQAAYWTQGNDPTIAGNSGPAGSGAYWIPEGSCGGGGGATPTPTATAKPTATATATATAKPTATATATATAKPTATATATAKPTATPTATPVTGKIFAPFEYVGDLGDANQLPGVISGSGVKAVILAFLVPSGNGCNLAWPGVSGNLPSDTLGSTSIGSVISQFQSQGITVAISQGGYGGQEAAAYCSSASATQAVYQQIISQYNVKWLDFDIEYSETSGQSTRRAAALAALQKANPGLMISFTLPADTPGDGVPDGLDASSNGGTTDVTDAIAAGVNLTIINGMAMDFGNTTTDQATLAEQTASAIQSWASSQGISSKIGITVLPGTSDTSGAVQFTLADATTLVNYAKGNSSVELLSFWELNRDNGGCPGSASDQDTCSGLTQSTWELSGIFNGF